MSCFGEKPKDCTCKILFLDETEISIEIKTSRRGAELLGRVFEHLNLLERDYFGLRFLDETNQTHWLDEKKPIGSQVKTLSPFTFYFGVKFYVADPCKLREELTRYQFFLQVKRDILTGRLPVPFDVAAELGAWALQSELGDFNPQRHPYGYVSEFRFVPNQTEDLEARIMHIHKKLAGHVPASAEYRYLDKCKWLDMYGVDLHAVQGEGNIEYFLGLTPTGIVVYKNKNRMANYFWPRITKVSHKGKTFMVRVKDRTHDETTHAFEVATKQACKHLWKCCVEQHTFFRLSQTSDATGKIVSIGSKHTYSTRSNRGTLTDNDFRPPAQVTRLPSKRYQRRVTVPNRQQVEDRGAHTDSEAMNGHILTPDPVRSSTGARRSESLPDSPRSTKSAPTRANPWEDANSIKGGLYTSGRESPQSARSERLKFPRRVPSGSDSEASFAQRRRHVSRRPPSDYESDGPLIAALRRRRRFLESGSDSDASYRVHMKYRGSGIDDAYASTLRPHGSMQSVGSENSQQLAARRRRKRSRSPGNKKPPEELAQHFRYVDPAELGMSEEQLKDIPFTNIETRAETFNVRYYNPHIVRSRHKSPKRKSTGEPEDPAGLHGMSAEEAPPPYTAAPAPDTLYPAYNHMPTARLARDDLKSPVSAYKNETVNAPVIKTRNAQSNSLPRGLTAAAIKEEGLYSAHSAGHLNQPTSIQPSQREDSGLGPEQDHMPIPRPYSGVDQMPTSSTHAGSYHVASQPHQRGNSSNYREAPMPVRPSGNTYSPPKRISTHPLKTSSPAMYQQMPQHQMHQQQMMWNSPQYSHHGHREGQPSSLPRGVDPRYARRAQPQEKITQL